MSAGVGGMGLHQPQRRLVCESPCLRARPRIIGHHAPLLRGAEEQVIEPTAQCRPAARRVAAPARVGRAKRQTVDKVTAQERWTNVASPGLVLSVPSMALLGTGYRVQGTGYMGLVLRVPYMALLPRCPMLTSTPSVAGSCHVATLASRIPIRDRSSSSTKPDEARARAESAEQTARFTNVEPSASSR